MSYSVGAGQLQAVGLTLQAAGPSAGQPQPQRKQSVVQQSSAPIQFPVKLQATSEPGRTHVHVESSQLAGPGNFKPNRGSQEKGRSGSTAKDVQPFVRRAALVVTGVGLGAGTSLLLARGGGGNWIGGNWGGGGGGGGGGEGGNFSRRFQAGAALAADDDDDEDDDDDDEDEDDDKDEEEEEKKDAKKKTSSAALAEESFDTHGMRVGTRVPVTKLSPSRRYKVGEVALIDMRNKQEVPKDDAFWDLIGQVRKGGVYTRSQMEQEFQALQGSGMFQDVSMEGEALEDGTLKVEVKFQESQWNPARSVRVVNVGLIPPDSQPPTNDPMRMEEQYRDKLRRARAPILPKRIERELSDYVSMQPTLTARMLQTIRDKIQKWYVDEGYVCAQVVNFGNLNTDEVVCEVVEGDITGVEIIFQDRLGEKGESLTNPKVVARELPTELKTGMIFNMEAGRKALQRISSLQMFANIEVLPRPDEEIEGGIVVEVKLKESEPKMAEVNTEWSITPGDSGKPTVANVFPGGSIAFEHRNINGLNRSLMGSVASSNLLNPQEELDFRMEYRHPYLDGIDDPRNRVGGLSIFNNRKLAAVFVGGPDAEEVPVVWVERAGLKATVSENYTRQSKFTYGIVMEEVTTRDENSAPCVQALKTLPNGMLSAEGPPTTHSDTGTDRVAFLQANLTRDNTTFVNGTVIGDRDIFQVDQGFFVGTKFPFFNRHQLSLTRFIQLSDENLEKKEEPPWVAVLHGRYGGCVGDLPNYEAYALGGPYSVRGYNMGELGASRRFLELAAELRVPVRKTHAYVFGEYGTDLGGSKDLRGDPTHFFGRMGHGGSVGVGVRLGQVRAEYIRDCNQGASSYFLRYGERF